MKEQLKAEAHVREQRPAKMNLTFGCEVAHIPSAELSIWYTGFYVEKSPRKSKKDMHVIFFPPERPTSNEYTVTIERKDFKIIGHPINLQDWLVVLQGKFEPDFVEYIGDELNFFGEMMTEKQQLYTLT